MKYLKILALTVVLLTGGAVIYGWTSDCGNTAGIYVHCSR